MSQLRHRKRFFFFRTNKGQSYWRLHPNFTWREHPPTISTRDPVYPFCIDVAKGFGRVNPFHSHQFFMNEKAETVEAYVGALYKYEGDVVINQDHFGISIPDTYTTLRPWGDKALSRISPLKPEFDYLINGAELRDIGQLIRSIKGMIRSYKNPVKSTSDGYLAYQFGLAPLLDALSTLFSMEQSLDKRVGSILSRKDKREHFRVELLDERDETTSTLTGREHFFPYSLTLFGNSSEVTIASKYTEKIWVEGYQTLTYPRGTSPKKVEEILRRFQSGKYLQADTIYQLSPWTWALDWFIDTGSWIHAMQARNFLRLEDWSIQHEQVSEKTYSSVLYYTKEDGSLGIATPSGTSRETLKRREPYQGPILPGVTWGYTPSVFQGSIVAALVGSYTA